MSLDEVEKQARALSEDERARLVASLLATLPPDVEISDDAVLQRDADLVRFHPAAERRHKAAGRVQSADASPNSAYWWVRRIEYILLDNL